MSNLQVFFMQHKNAVENAKLACFKNHLFSASVTDNETIFYNEGGYSKY